VQAQCDVAENISQEQHAQKIVAKELNKRQVYKRHSSDQFVERKYSGV